MSDLTQQYEDFFRMLELIECGDFDTLLAEFDGEVSE